MNSKLILPLFLLCGCVVPYGDAPQTSAVTSAQAASPMKDLTGLEARLLLLMDENQDADRAARLEALRGLLRGSRTWTPDAQRDLVVYLEAVLRVEERWRADVGLEGFAPLLPGEDATPQVEIIDDAGTAVAVPLVEEPLDEPAGVMELPEASDPVTESPGRSADAIRAEAVTSLRELLSRSAYAEALERLAQLDSDLLEADGVDEGEQAGAIAALQQEAVDGWVGAERERAGKLFLAARELPDPAQRAAAFEEVVSILEGLLADYPQSSFSDALARNLQLVQRELGVE
jgi:hypothetical protein